MSGKKRRQKQKHGQQHPHTPALKLAPTHNRESEGPDKNVKRQKLLTFLRSFKAQFKTRSKPE
jgi:hypothetical protein